MWIVWMTPENLSMHSIRTPMWRIVYSKRMPLLLIGMCFWYQQIKIVVVYIIKLINLFIFFGHREFDSRANIYQCHGAIINKNRIEDFKTCDKLALINEEGKLIWNDIASGACLEKPSLLTRFFVFSFGVSPINLLRHRNLA